MGYDGVSEKEASRHGYGGNDADWWPNRAEIESNDESSVRNRD